MASQSIVLAHEPPFRIGKAEVRPASRELASASGTHMLEPRVMQVLVALHEAHGNVLSKDDLIACCWDGRIVGEDAINRVIGHLRRAIAEAGEPFRVETIPRVGYRIAGDGMGDAGLPFSPMEGSRRSLLLGGTAALAALAAGGWWLERRRDELPAGVQEVMDRGYNSLFEGTSGTVASATAAFREAAAKAPERDQPWGGLALAYAMQAITSDPVRYEDFARRSAAAANRALSINPANGEALGARLTMLPPDLPWGEFEQRVLAALKIAPDTPCLHNMLGFFYWSVGRIEEGFALTSRFAEQIDPNPRLNVGLAEMLASLHRADEAEQIYNASIERWPRNTPVWFTRFKFLMYNGAAERALAMLDDVAMRPTGIDDYNWGVCRAQALALAQPTPERRQAGIDISLDSAKRGSGYAENALLFTAFIGALDHAFDLAERILLKRSTLPATRFSKAQASFANRLRPYTQLLFRKQTESMLRDPRITSLWQRLGLEAYWRLSGRQPDFRR